MLSCDCFLLLIGVFFFVANPLFVFVQCSVSFWWVCLIRVAFCCWFAFVFCFDLPWFCFGESVCVLMFV